MSGPELVLPEIASVGLELNSSNFENKEIYTRVLEGNRALQNWGTVLCRIGKCECIKILRPGGGQCGQLLDRRFDWRA